MKGDNQGEKNETVEKYIYNLKQNFSNTRVICKSNFNIKLKLSFDFVFFLCFAVYRPTREFIWRRHHYR